MHFDVSNLFTWNNLSIALDVLIIWYLVYCLIMMIRGTKAVQLAKGIVFIFIVRIVAGLLQLHAVTYIVDQIVSWAVIGIIVIFQPEIRRGLERLGRTPIFNGRGESPHDQSVRMVKELDKAIQYMSKRKIGALITIERNTGLEEYIETGIPIGAEISGELLINIFIPNTPLHDGAVIVRDGKVAVACAYLPLSESTLIPKEFGTRHRAAVGVSEVSDALTIIVSEETGEVSLTMNHQLKANVSQDTYLEILRENLVPEIKIEKKNFMTSIMDELNKFNRGGK